MSGIVDYRTAYKNNIEGYELKIKELNLGLKRNIEALNKENEKWRNYGNVKTRKTENFSRSS